MSKTSEAYVIAADLIGQYETEDADLNAALDYLERFLRSAGKAAA
jgi:hypothetical protein